MAGGDLREGSCFQNVLLSLDLSQETDFSLLTMTMKFIIQLDTFQDIRDVLINSQDKSGIIQDSLDKLRHSLVCILPKSIN